MTDPAPNACIIAALAEQAGGERRVALTPDMAAKYRQDGHRPMLEAGAGGKTGFVDDAYQQAGAELVQRGEVLAQADILLCAAPLSPEDIAAMKPGAALVGLLAPHQAEPLIAAAKQANIAAFALENLPRISRAQPMDVLSSQANLAGYRAVIEGQALLSRIMPMMMTAAGTIAAAKVLVLGAGVAGLQAIATAKRLGARVLASDVRAEVAEQVESLGARFLAVEGEEGEGEGKGGYAATTSADYQRRQKTMLMEVLKEQDLVICTALIPGKPAPELLSAEMVKIMPAGSVIVDMAGAQGGNCALSKPGEVIEAGDITIAAPLDLISGAAYDASSLLARNFYAFMDYLLKAGGVENFPADDEILSATLLVPAKKSGD